MCVCVFYSFIHSLFPCLAVRWGCKVRCEVVRRVRMEQLLLSDALECSVCLEQLGSHSRVLPCQHTFCRRCLDDIVHTQKVRKG